MAHARVRLSHFWCTRPPSARGGNGRWLTGMPRLCRWAAARGVAGACTSLLLAGLGCAAGSANAHPRDALHQYALALREGQVAQAYSLLSRDARADLSLLEFTRMVEENSIEIDALTADLLRPVEHSQVTATLISPDGERLRLVYEGDAWRVHGSALDLYARDTPEATLASFVRAYENGRYDLLMHFVPDSARQGLTVEALRQAWEGEQREQMQRLTQALKASLPSLRVERIGTRATVEYGAGASVELKFERGSWKIEDF